MSEKNRTRKKTAKAAAVGANTTKQRPARTAPPWIVDGVDYGPAILAVEDLATWAFDLVSANVDDWPEGQRRVANARRLVRAALRGKPIDRDPHEDVVFTAALLVRILDADLGLGLSDVVSVLDEMGLPTEEAASVPPRKPTRPGRKRRLPPDLTTTQDDGKRLAHLTAVLSELAPDEVEIVKRTSKLHTTKQHDEIVTLLCGLSIADAVAWIRTEMIATAPTPLRVEPRVIRVAPLHPSCSGCPAAFGFRRAA